MCMALVAALGLSDRKFVSATIGGRTEAKCLWRCRRVGSWLTAYLWAPTLVGGQRSRFHYVGGGCVHVLSIAVNSSFACCWQRPHVTGSNIGGVGGKIEAAFSWC